ncbi:Very-long-chain 3-oxoacyl-CoA reductase [Cytospora mali]|uniref:Very-long-chain 3-oxoacyl-CoA reductase n=1 Tax=Cytospora mali TaxID=578113 RepID=A0A194V0L9_CYTMA|nr:Very-long-chain 3-oxoacyl-CoA reductase [Valsa mali var. pyri (nom. inval.)]
MEIPRTVLHVLAFIGTLVSLTVLERVLDFLSFHFTTPGRPLEAYRRRGPKPTYALITGASAGLGYGIAQALVKNGFGVILLGHKEDELKESAAKLQALIPEEHQAQADGFIKTIVMDAQTATPGEMEDKLRTTIIDEELRVSILVNNVGSNPVAAPPFRDLRTYSPDDIDGVIDLNARFMARLTTLMLPVLIERGAGIDSRGMSFGTHRRSLILNMSSAGHIGLPWLIMYGATKAFNLAFSRGLSRELEADPETRHIDCLAVVPGDVRSQGNCMGVSKGSPDSDIYGQYIVEKVDGAVSRGWREMTPYWWHHFQGILANLVAERYVTRAAVNLVKPKRDAFNAVHKPKDE